MSFLVAGLFAAACGGCAAVGGGQVSYQGYGGTAIVSADGRTVTVGQYGAAVCGSAITPVARESAARVAVFLRYVPSAATPPCPQAFAMVSAYNIRLGTPLGSRTLVDGTTGRPITWISARLVLRPVTLPAGYQLRALTAAGNSLHTGKPPPVGCVQTFVSETGAVELVIAQSAGTVRLGGSGPVGWLHIQVRGHPGLASRNVITWRENGLTDYIAAGPGPKSAEAPSFTTQQLIAIADSASAYSIGQLPIPAP